MADKKISELTAATTPLAGTEVLPIVQSGTTVKASIANVQTATYSGGTANGVAFLDASKVLTTGSGLVFDGTNFSTTGTIKGSTTISVGAATPSSSGAGVTFPATQSASSDANTLDDYEEGAWTPGLAFGGLAVGVTYYSQVGFYTRVGNIVHLSGYIFLSSKGSSTGNLTITGLPFTVVNNNAGYSTSSLRTSKVTFAGQIMANVVPNSTTIQVNNSSITGVNTDLTNINIVGDETSIIIYASYRVA
jgi:hypothetical protein